MPNVSEIMTKEVQVVGPEENLQHAAQLMQKLNVGTLPVCDGERLLGMVTDRDITIRGTAAGLAPDSACVSDVMSADVEWCTEDQDSVEVLKRMGDMQVRRLPVIDLDHRLVGIVSLGDMALHHPGDLNQPLRDISAPSEEMS